MPPEALHGVTMEQYAGVTAALGDAFPLGELLANEGIAPARWSTADVAWKQRLAADGEGGALFTAFRGKRGEAEDWLGRSVTPIDSDLAAWIGFLHAFSAHPSPFELLAGAGLRMNDVARLQRRWARRMSEDPGLSKQAAEIVKKGPGPLPTIHAGIAELRPFPWSKGRARSPKPAASVVARAPAAPPPAARAFEAPAVAALPAPPPAAPPAAAVTSLALDVPRGTPLPFAKGAAPREIAKGSGEPPPRKPLAAFDETSPELEIPLGPVLPFAASSRAEAAPPKRPPAVFDETSPELEVPLGPVLPFTAPALPAPPLAVPLTLEQHASLCVELAGAPERAAETLGRYRLTPAQKVLADSHFRERVAKDPKVRDAWNRAFSAYREWFIAKAQRKG